MIAVDHVLRRAALFLGTDSDGHAMLVAAADEKDIFALQTQVADIDVSRHINSSQMTDVDGTVGIRQSRRHQCSLEFPFSFHKVLWLHFRFRLQRYK